MTWCVDVALPAIDAETDWESLAAVVRPPQDLDEKKRVAVSEDVSRMRKIFSEENLVAGAEILQALVTELELGGKELAWYRRSDNTGLMSFVAEKSGFRN